MAHEIVHVGQFQRERGSKPVRNARRESEPCRHATEALISFLKQREILLESWGPESEQTPDPKPTIKERNREKTVKDLARWKKELERRQRAVKAAQKKVTEYGRKARRYGEA